MSKYILILQNKTERFDITIKSFRDIVQSFYVDRRACVWVGNDEWFPVNGD